MGSTPIRFTRFWKVIPARAGRGLENRWSRKAWRSTRPAFRQQYPRSSADRAADYESAGRRFKSCRGCQYPARPLRVARSILTSVAPATVASTNTTAFGGMAEWFKALACYAGTVREDGARVRIPVSPPTCSPVSSPSTSAVREFCRGALPRHFWGVSSTGRASDCRSEG
jgi:hypothetical protein